MILSMIFKDCLSLCVLNRHTRYVFGRHSVICNVTVMYWFSFMHRNAIFKYVLMFYSERIEKSH